MSEILITLFVIAGLVGLFLWKMSRPVKYRIARIGELKPLLQAVRDRATDGSVIILTDKASKRFVQFAKRGEDPKEATFLFGFPDAPWSREIFQDVQEAFRREDIKCSVVPADGEQTKRFLYVEAIQDLDYAIQVAKVALRAMELETHGDFVASIDAGMSRRLATKATRDHIV